MVIRLNSTSRMQAGLHRAEAKMMHIAPDTQINIPMPVKRYNYRTPNGEIHKITLFDSDLIEKVIKKVGNQYKPILAKIVGEGKTLTYKY